MEPVGVLGSFSFSSSSPAVRYDTDSRAGELSLELGGRRVWTLGLRSTLLGERSVGEREAPVGVDDDDDGDDDSGGSVGSLRPLLDGGGGVKYSVGVLEPTPVLVSEMGPDWVSPNMPPDALPRKDSGMDLPSVPVPLRLCVSLTGDINDPMSLTLPTSDLLSPAESRCFSCSLSDVSEYSDAVLVGDKSRRRDGPRSPGV